MNRVGAVLKRLRIDPFILAMAAAVALAFFIPVDGDAAVTYGHVTDIVIAMLFFLYGARLEPRAVWEGVKHWRLHLVILSATFVLFPVIGLATHLLTPVVLTPALWAGVMYLCLLPSTVQSSIALTSIAKGNVAAAICSASISNLLGVVLTPVLVGVFLSTHGGGFDVGAIGEIALILVLPFVLGQLARPFISVTLHKHPALLKLFDRGSIVLVVYGAFSKGVVAGVWEQVSLGRLAVLLLILAVILAIVLAVTGYGSRALRFSKPDQASIIFCGSVKSLASGLPMAVVLFSGDEVGLIVLPMLLFHQLQLMVCAFIAPRLARRSEPPQPVAP